MDGGVQHTSERRGELLAASAPAHCIHGFLQTPESLQYGPDASC